MSAVMCINAGSTSLKFAVYQSQPTLVLQCRGQIEGLQDQPTFAASDAQGHALPPPRGPLKNPLDHRQALTLVLDWLKGPFPDLKIQAAAHRIVHGGERFSAPVLLDDEVLNYLETLCVLEPSHQTVNVGAARAMLAAHPGLRQIACFDTAFHRHMPAVAQHYAVAPELRQAGLQHWGFHGISYEYLSHRMQADWPQARRVIAMHLGGGASVCALKDGQSVDTSMGFGAISGLPMSTRCGDLPVEGVLYLLRSKRFTLDELEPLLFQKSGLLGLSGLSGDMRTLEARSPDHAPSRFAIDSFVYALSKYVGAYAAVLGGVDALVFSGGIGEHSALVRAAVCQRLAWLGVALDETANLSQQACISSPGSAIAVRVLPTDEELMMARHAQTLLAPAPPPPVSRVAPTQGGRCA